MESTRDKEARRAQRTLGLLLLLPRLFFVIGELYNELETIFESSAPALLTYK
jgi:hypothetical protein